MTLSYTTTNAGLIFITLPTYLIKTYVQPIPGIQYESGGPFSICVTDGSCKQGANSDRDEENASEKKKACYTGTTTFMSWETTFETKSKYKIKLKCLP